MASTFTFKSPKETKYDVVSLGEVMMRIDPGDIPTARARIARIWHGGGENEAELLSSAYQESLKVASENHLNSISFPSISTGAYGYPVDAAARVAIGAVSSFLQTKVTSIRKVVFVLFDSATFNTYSSALGEVLGVQ